MNKSREKQLKPSQQALGNGGQSGVKTASNGCKSKGAGERKAPSVAGNGPQSEQFGAATATDAGQAFGLHDLKPAPYNPRKISPEALAGLKRSLSEFGDLSGFVWNKRTGHLVAGHQRLDALQREYGEQLVMEDGAVVTPTGECFPVRVVNWPVSKEKAANLAANSPLIQGEFDTAGLEGVLTDLNAVDGFGDMIHGLRLDELIPGLDDLLPELNKLPSVTNDAMADMNPDGGRTGTVAELPADPVPPSGNSEWLNFAVPLSVAQHKTVMDAVRVARQRGAAKVNDALFVIASSYLEGANGK